MFLSIIIPTYNEADRMATMLQHLLALLPSNQRWEVILVDSPQSTDHLAAVVQPFAVTLLKAPKAGRAAQLNFGAASASGDMLYFIHADTHINPSFWTDIQESIANGFQLGCYRYLFDAYPSPLLHINAFFTRFSPIWCRGGDQTLFITKIAFEQLNGYNDTFLIMEDYDILQRAKQLGLRFRIVPKNIIVSARKYATNNYLKVQWANFCVMRMYLKGNASQDEMAATYKRLLIYR